MQVRPDRILRAARAAGAVTPRQILRRVDRIARSYLYRVHRPPWADLLDSLPAARLLAVPALDLVLDRCRPRHCWDVGSNTVHLPDGDVCLRSDGCWTSPRTALGRYELNYLSWALPNDLDAAPSVEDFRSVLTSWQQANPFGSRPAWEPYPASRRVPVLAAWLGIAEREPDLSQMIVAELHRHHAYISRNMERDLGGNHLLANLFAVCVTAAVTDRDGLRPAVEAYKAELTTQVYEDGGHIERSPGYHVDVLWDARVVLELARDAHLDVADLELVTLRMADWASAMRLRTGELPALHDGRPVRGEELDRLGIGQSSASAMLQESCYFIARNDHAEVIFDVGTLGAPHLAGHGHASCLSVVVTEGRRDILVDTGCSTYESGPRRDYERGTAAHNTVSLSDLDQAELWGSFRVGRRPRVTVREADTGKNRCVADHDGYRHLHGRPVHRRTIQLFDDRLLIHDDVQGAGTHRVTATAVLPESQRAELDDEGDIVLSGGSMTLVSSVPSDATLDEVSTASGFGVLTPARRLVRTTQSALPISLTTTIRWTA